MDEKLLSSEVPSKGTKPYESGRCCKTIDSQHWCGFDVGMQESQSG